MGVCSGTPPATGSMRTLDLAGQFDSVEVSAAVLEWQPDASADVVRAYTHFLQKEFFAKARFMEDRLLANLADLYLLGPDRDSYASIRTSCIEFASERVRERAFTESGFKSFRFSRDAQKRHLRAMCSPDGWTRFNDVQPSEEASKRARKLCSGAGPLSELLAACWLEHRMFRGLPLPENSQHPLDEDMSSEVFHAKNAWLKNQRH